MSIVDAYLRMINEAKKEKEKPLDPVGDADADIDNDGDVDKSDEYLHNRRKEIKKSMKDEAVEIDPDNGEVTKKKEKKKKGDDSTPDDSKGDVQEATYQVDIAGEGRATVSARSEKEAIAKAYSKMGLRSVRTRLKGMAPKATVKLVKEDNMIEQADQEKLEPKAQGEKEFADKHTVDVVDRPDATKQDGAEKVKAAPARPGDNKQADKLKTFKDIRK